MKVYNYENTNVVKHNIVKEIYKKKNQKKHLNTELKTSNCENTKL